MHIVDKHVLIYDIRESRVLWQQVWETERERNGAKGYSNKLMSRAIMTDDYFFVLEHRCRECCIYCFVVCSRSLCAEYSYCCVKMDQKNLFSCEVFVFVDG